MACRARCVKGKADCWIFSAQMKEGMSEIVRIQQSLIVVYDVCDIQKDLIQTELLDLIVPSEGLQELVEHLRGIPEPIQLLAQHDHHIWTDTFRFRDELQLMESTAASFIVTGDKDLFLLDAEGKALQGRILGLKNRCVEAVIILQLSDLIVPRSLDCCRLTKCMIIRPSFLFRIAFPGVVMASHCDDAMRWRNSHMREYQGKKQQH